MTTGSSFQLYTADAIDLMRALPDESVDLIITDVAYESLEKHRAVGTTTRLKQSDASSNEWFPIFRNSRFGEFFQESFRVLKKNAHLYFYCDPETAFAAKPVGEAAGFKFWKPLVWSKTKQGMTPDADDLTVDHQGIGMGYHYRASYEFVLFFEKGKRKLNDLGVRDLLPFPGIRNGYPTEKPTDLNRVFVRQSSEAGETVLDPFMGSGSAGVAAVRNDRHFIGGDIKESAVEGARKRLLANAATDGGQAFTVVEGARPPEPEPPPKKTRAKKKPADVMPIAEMDGADIMLNASREEPEDGPTQTGGYLAAIAEAPVEATCPQCLARVLCVERETSCPCGNKLTLMPRATAPTSGEPPKYRAYAFADGKVQGEVPNVMFEVKVSDAPLPPPPAVSFIEQLEAAFAIPADPGCSLDLLEPEPPPFGHISGYLNPAENIEPPPRPATCQHGDVRSVCILCRARR